MCKYNNQTLWKLFGLDFRDSKKTSFMREVFFDINSFISLEFSFHLHNDFSAVEECYCSMRNPKSGYWVLIVGELPCNTVAAIFIMLCCHFSFPKGCHRMIERLEFSQIMQNPWQNEAEDQHSEKLWDPDHSVCLELEPVPAPPLSSKLLLCLAMGPQWQHQTSVLPGHLDMSILSA